MFIAKSLTLEFALERLVDLLPLLAIAIGGTAILEIVVYLFFKKVLRSKYTLPYTLVAPAAVAMLLFTVYPFAYNIRLAFSDLRLKTFNCYVPNSGIVGGECSLTRAAPGADVEFTLDEFAARVEPNEKAEVAFVLHQGAELHVTSAAKRITGYIWDPGTARPVKVDDEGNVSLDNRVCNPLDKGCAEAYNEFKKKYLINQDERLWWPVQSKDGESGWIPNEVYYIVADAPLYAEQYGEAIITIGDEPARVSQGQAVRLAAKESTPSKWYHIQLSDGRTGWINAAFVQVSRSFYPEDDAPLYVEHFPDAASYIEGDEPVTLEAGTEYELAQAVTVTWYEVLVGEGDRFGWLNIPAQEPPMVTVFTAGSDAEVYDSITDIDEDGNQPAEAQSIGTIKAGDRLIQKAVDLSTGVTWFQVQRYHVEAGEKPLVGWVATDPVDMADVALVTFTPGTPLFEQPDRSSAVLATLEEGNAVQFISRDASQDQNWHGIRVKGDQVAWTMVEGRIEENFTAAQSEDVPSGERVEATNAYAEPGGIGGVVEAVPLGQRLTIVDPIPARFMRYRVVVLDDNGIALEDEQGYPVFGWVDVKPEKVITTERDPVLYSLQYGWENFKRVFVKTDSATGKITGWGRLLQTQNSTFPRLLRTTLAWTGLNVIFHLFFGMILALLLNRPNMKLRGLYRAIIILPWAIPQTIIALAWRGEFHSQFGFVNHLLTEIGIEPVNWLFTPGPAFAAVTFVNIWLGIPFYMVTLLGGLQSIAGEYYEAAKIDGANAWHRFRHVTIPLIRPVAVPIITLDVIWTFNNFNVIYLITQGRPNESTNILVTALYNAAFGRNGQTQLGFASAFSLVIFAILFLFAAIWVTSSGVLKGVYEE